VRFPTTGDNEMTLPDQNCLRIVQAGSMKEPLQSLAYSIFSICTKRSISIDIQWIPRKENPKATTIYRRTASGSLINHLASSLTAKTGETNLSVPKIQ
jgi:hypothetical protein